MDDGEGNESMEKCLVRWMNSTRRNSSFSILCFISLSRTATTKSKPAAEHLISKQRRRIHSFTFFLYNKNPDFYSSPLHVLLPFLFYAQCKQQQRLEWQRRWEKLLDSFFAFTLNEKKEKLYEMVGIMKGMWINIHANMRAQPTELSTTTAFRSSRLTFPKKLQPFIQTRNFLLERLFLHSIYFFVTLTFSFAWNKM